MLRCDRPLRCYPRPLLRLSVSPWCLLSWQLLTSFAKQRKDSKARHALLTARLSKDFLSTLREHSREGESTIVRITRYEYVLGMLTLSGQITGEDIQVLETRFAQLDTSHDGTLTEDDLVRDREQGETATVGPKHPSQMIQDADVIWVAAMGVIKIPCFFVLDPTLFGICISGILDVLAVIIAHGQTSKDFTAVSCIAMLSLLTLLACVLSSGFIIASPSLLYLNNDYLRISNLGEVPVEQIRMHNVVAWEQLAGSMQSWIVFWACQMAFLLVNVAVLVRFLVKLRLEVRNDRSWSRGHVIAPRPSTLEFVHERVGRAEDSRNELEPVPQATPPGALETDT